VLNWLPDKVINIEDAELAAVKSARLAEKPPGRRPSVTRHAPAARRRADELLVARHGMGEAKGAFPCASPGQTRPQIELDEPEAGAHPCTIAPWVTPVAVLVQLHEHSQAASLNAVLLNCSELHSGLM
jgi:hypothetical protein